MTPLTAAVVGTGFIGPVHVEAIRRLSHRVAGALGSTAGRGRAAADRLGLPRAYATLDELLADPAVQVVHVTSPNRHHADHCRRAVADIGTHWLDLVTWVTGLEVEELCADLRTVHPTRRRPAGVASVETFQA